MQASALYGLVMGIAAFLFMRAMPQPTGSIILWGFIAGELSWGAIVCWRRTGLPFATTAMIVGAMSSAVLAVLAAAGHVFPDLPFTWWALVVLSLVSGPLLLLVESRVNRARWKRWAEFMEGKSLWDVVTGRHVPFLRDSGA